MQTRAMTIQSLCPWIMGMITLVISFFSPPYSWGLFFGSGAYWKLREIFPASLITFSSLRFVSMLASLFIVLFPSVVLSACIIWIWRARISKNPTFFYALFLVPLAMLLALLGVAGIFLVGFLLLLRGEMNGMSMLVALANTWFVGGEFLGCLPFLLPASIIIVGIQKKFRFG